MNRSSRALSAAAALLLSAVYALPLWRISLIAPQYPEGLGMLIRINTMQGVKEHDLNNINELNHYIGMKIIDPLSIPELRYFPWVVAALVAGGLAVALRGRRGPLLAWVAAFAAAAGLGLWDFWRWSYDYGHNLDLENAIIKVPGAVYQPPILGVRQILNFTASSWPAAGGVAAFLAFGLALAAVAVAYRARPHRTLLVVLTLLLAAGCGQNGVNTGDPHAGGAHHQMGAGSQHPTAPTPATPAGEGREARVVVSPDGPIRSIGAALRETRSGGTVIVRAGMYREPTIVVARPVTIRGEGFPTLDGEGMRQIMSVSADDVTVRGLHFIHTGDSQMEDRAAIRISSASGCLIEGNRFDDNFFGIYLADVSNCTLRGNVLRGATKTQESTGNGIHLWSSRDVLIEENRISGHRDGIYFEFTNRATARRNVSERNLRYGLHFMFSDDCRYLENQFRHNGSGVAVMYTKRVEMTGNRFEDNLGPAAYGLLLKEIEEPVLTANVFRSNTVGLYADGASHIRAARNVFEGNGWGVKLMASTADGEFIGNDFVGNSFDVATNSRGSDAKFLNNYFDEYRGYDLDGDGLGDVPHHPVRLFSLVVEQNEPALILLRGIFVSLLDQAERFLPALTPATLMDPHPRMHGAA